MSIENNPFDHILYEFQMYLASYPIDSGDPILNNMRIDSHLIHLRNVAAFFDMKKGKHTDIHAPEYVNNSGPFLINSKWLKNVYNCTSGAACHMSKERLRTDFKQKTMSCIVCSFHIFLPLIIEYLNALEIDLNSKYSDLWNDEKIKERLFALKVLIVESISKLDLSLTTSL